MNPRHPLLACLLMLLLSATPLVGQQTPEELFQSALYKQQIEGDLEGARAILETLIEDFADHREVAANALVLLGRVHETLGSTQAERAYRRVLNEYPEQRVAADEARTRLARLTQEMAEVRHQPTFRKIEIASKPQNGVMSPDGDKLAFVSDGGLWMLPLHGKVNPDIAGEPVRLADVPDIWDNGSLMAWSADGKWIAVNSMAEDEASVYMVPASGGEPRRVDLPDRGGHAWSYRLSLSPDGGTLAFSALELGTREEVPESHSRYIYTIPTAGGEPVRVSSGWGRLPSFSPDGKHIAYVGYRERADRSENAEHSGYDGDLWIVSPTGGNPMRLASVDGRLRGPAWSPDGAYIAAHYEPGGTNSSKEIWVFPLSADQSSAGEPTRIALPRGSFNMVAGWTPHGELGVFMQSELHEAIYTVPTAGGKAVQVTPEGRSSYYPRWSPDGERIYLRTVQEETPHVIMTYVPASGGELVEVSVRPERWLVSRVPGGGLNVSPDGERLVVSAYQEPFDPKEGLDLWTIPVHGGHPTRLTSDGSFEGYPCWSPDGRWVAFTDWYETAEDEGFDAIYVVGAEGGATRRITSETDSVGGGGIAFSPDGERIAFFSNGAIKTISVGGGQPEVLIADVRSGRHDDLAWSPDGTMVAFGDAGEIWIASVDGGTREELRTGLPEGTKYGAFSWSPDGQKIAFVGSSGGEAEFWLISDFLPEKR
jgi:Tol biopolymer transport system component